MNAGKKASMIDSLNILLELIICLDKDDINHAKIRIKEYGYISNPEFIMKLLDYVYVQKEGV